MKKRVLVIAGPLADYHYRLFDKVRELVNTEWLFLVSIRKSRGEFAHQYFVPRNFKYMDVKKIGLLNAIFVVIKYKPSVIFFYGNKHKLLLGLVAIIGNIRNVKMYYTSDDNISQIKPLLVRLGKTAVLFFLTLMKVEFLSLGYTHRLFFKRNFVRKIHDIPCYAVAFEDWDEHITDDLVKKIKFLTIARLVEVKNIKNLILSFNRLSSEIDDVCLNIIGDGPCHDELNRLICNISNTKIKLVGSVARKEIGTYIYSHDAIVLPSFKEPWGIVAVEALGCGKPVIATKEVGSALSLSGIVGGIVLSENTSADSLYVALKTYIKNKAQYNQLAQNQKEWIVKKYGDSFVAEKYAELIDKNVKS